MQIDLRVGRAAKRSLTRVLRRLAPPVKLSLSEWADQYRRLSPESSGEPGRWSTSRAEYQREMMDALTDPRIGTVVLKTSARVGKTQACVNNLFGYHIHRDPGNLMLVLPTDTRCDEWSEDEFDPMARDTPALRSILGGKQSRASKDRRKHKKFPGGRLYIVGANAPSGLAAKTVRVLCCDEIDRYAASAGREGDAVEMAIRRANTIWNRKVVLSSTPTIAGQSRIDKAYAESDQRQYHVPCPHCAEEQTLRWEQVRWDADDPSTARYYCCGCGAALTEAERGTAVKKGRWVAGAPFTGTAGFHINELYSPWRKLSETATDYLRAKRTGTEALKVWINTAMGEVWQEAGEAPEWERLLERVEPYEMGTVPAGSVVLTGSVDNQSSPERLEWSVWGWAPGFESWLVDAGSEGGSPSDAATWDRIAEVFDRDWPCAGGGTMRVARIGADTGGNHTQGVYLQLRRLRDPRWMPLKGVPGWTRSEAVTGPKLVDLTPAGAKVRRGLKLWTVAVDHWKAELYRRLWVTPREDGTYPPGRVHLPNGYGVERVKQLVAEELITKQTRQGFSKREWRKLRANEQLDLAVYARAALSLLGADRLGERFWAMKHREAAAVTTRVPALASALPVAATPAAVPAPVEMAPLAAVQAPPQPAARRSRWSY